MLASRIRGSNKEMPNAFNYSQINLKNNDVYEFAKMAHRSAF